MHSGGLIISKHTICRPISHYRIGRRVVSERTIIWTSSPFLYTSCEPKTMSSEVYL